MGESELSAMPLWRRKTLSLILGAALGTAYYFAISRSLATRKLPVEVWNGAITCVAAVVVIGIGCSLQLWQSYVTIVLGGTILVNAIWRLSRKEPEAAPPPPEAPQVAQRVLENAVNTAFIKLETSGLTMAYEVFGDPKNPAVLLLHGLGADMTIWPSVEFVEPLAARGYYVIRPDLRDSGQSDYMLGKPGFSNAEFLSSQVRNMMNICPKTNKAPYTMDDMAQDCADLLKGLGVESAVVVGHSMGGMVAQTMALNHADRMLGLFSLSSCTGPGVGPHNPNLLDIIKIQMSQGKYGAEKNATVATEKGIQQIVEAKNRFYHMILGDYCDSWDWHRRIIERRIRRLTKGYLAYKKAESRQIAAISVAPQRARLLADAVDNGSISFPIVIVHGTKDTVVPLSNAQFMKTEIPSAKLVTLPGMGHIIAPEVCGELLREFETSFSRETLLRTSATAL